MAGHIQRTPATRNFPKGGWEARYRARVEGRMKWRAQTFKTKREAERFLAATVTDIHRGEYIDPSKQQTPFETVAAQWLGAARLQLRPKTIASYEWTLTKRLLPEWRDVAVGSVDLDAVQGWVNRISEEHSASAVVGAYRVLRLVLGHAVDTGKLRSNPCNRRVKLPKVEHTERKYLTHEQVDALANAISYRPAIRKSDGAPSKHAMPIDRPDLGVLVRFAAYTGLRAGEIAALRVRHLDLTAGTVSVEDAVSDVAGKLIAGRPKTKAGQRLVPLDEDMCALLKAHLGERRLRPDAWVFVGRYGAQWNHSNFRGRFWKEAVRRAGLPEELRFHDLRHTYASFLVQAGVHVREMAELLGHASAQITLDLYSHIMPGAKATTAAKLGALRRDALDGSTGQNAAAG
jgi:integrase